MSAIRDPRSQVYVLRDPRDGRARYVGQSISPEGRLRSHVTTSRNKQMASWVDELTRCGVSPVLELLHGADEGEWIKRLNPDLNSVSDGRGRGGGRAGAGRRPSSGSGYTIPISFKLQPDLRASGVRLAESQGISIGELAKRALLELLSREGSPAIPTEDAPGGVY